MKLLIKITAFVTVAIMATSALPTGGVDLTVRRIRSHAMKYLHH